MFTGNEPTEVSAENLKDDGKEDGGGNGRGQRALTTPTKKQCAGAGHWGPSGGGRRSEDGSAGRDPHSTPDRQERTFPESAPDRKIRTFPERTPDGASAPELRSGDRRNGRGAGRMPAQGTMFPSHGRGEERRMVDPWGPALGARPKERETAGADNPWSGQRGHPMLTGTVYQSLNGDWQGGAPPWKGAGDVVLPNTSSIEASWQQGAICRDPIPRPQEAQKGGGSGGFSPALAQTSGGTFEEWLECRAAERPAQGVLGAADRERGRWRTTGSRDAGDTSDRPSTPIGKRSGQAGGAPREIRRDGGLRRVSVALRPVYPRERVAGAQAGMFLGLSLSGVARRLLTGIDSSSEKGYWELRAALERRFQPRNQEEMYKALVRTRSKREEETLQAYAEDLRRLTRLAYPEAEAKTTDSMARDRFVDGLRDGRLRHWICQNEPHTIEDAVSVALKAEVFLKAEEEKGGAVRATNTTMAEQLKALTEQVASLQSQGMGPRDRRPFGNRRNEGYHKRCFRCDKEGHFRRECPMPPPPAELARMEARARREQENIRPSEN